MNATLSSEIVSYLQSRGMTLRHIGKLAGLSESFVSRVANGHRSFTIRHLEALETELGRTLPALLLEAKSGAVPRDKRPMFDEALRLLDDLGGLRGSLRPTDGRLAKSRKRAARKPAATKLRRAAM